MAAFERVASEVASVQPGSVYCRQVTDREARGHLHLAGRCDRALKLFVQRLYEVVGEDVVVLRAPLCAYADEDDRRMDFECPLGKSGGQMMKSGGQSVEFEGQIMEPVRQIRESLGQVKEFGGQMRESGGHMRESLRKMKESGGQMWKSGSQMMESGLKSRESLSPQMQSMHRMVESTDRMVESSDQVGKSGFLRAEFTEPVSSVADPESPIIESGHRSPDADARMAESVEIMDVDHERNAVRPRLSASVSAGDDPFAVHMTEPRRESARVRGCCRHSDVDASSPYTEHAAIQDVVRLSDGFFHLLENAAATSGSRKDDQAVGETMPLRTYLEVVREFIERGQELCDKIRDARF